MSADVILQRNKDGRIAIQSAPEIFLCSRESIQDMIDRHNALLEQATRFTEALRRIANTDYRGNRSAESSIAYTALTNEGIKP